MIMKQLNLLAFQNETKTKYSLKELIEITKNYDLILPKEFIYYESDTGISVRTKDKLVIKKRTKKKIATFADTSTAKNIDTRIWAQFLVFSRNFLPEFIASLELAERSSQLPRKSSHKKIDPQF